MKHELQIVEEFQSSQWGHISIREALSIAREILNFKPVYVFKKVHDHGKIRGKKLYKEGWALETDSPTFYSCVGSTMESVEEDFFMLTMSSVEGEKKESFPPTTRYWTMWYSLEIMFAEAGLIASRGRVVVKYKDKLEQLVKEWEAILSRCDGRPMITVLGLYSGDELDIIINSTPKRMHRWIERLEEYLNTTGPVNFGEVPLLAKGLDGRVISAKLRIQSRVAFWKEWNRTREREDVFSLAKTYSIVSDDWRGV